jgi:hypothetical protein
MSKNGRKDKSRSADPVPQVEVIPSAPLSEPPGPDDLSVPPMGDLDAAFFDRPVTHDHDLEPEAPDPRLAMKMAPGVARRRAHLARYVKGAVAVASMLCVAAFLKAAVARGRTETREAREAPRTTTVISAAAAPAPAPEPAAAPAPAPAPAPEPAAAPAPAPTPSPASAPAPEPSAETAAQARAASQAALERGKVGVAIAAGERAVALDPTDGNAWLILGAAYQQKGAMKDARRCYKACVDEGKRGPRGECAAMLR